MSDLKQHLVALGLPIARTKPIKDLQEEDLKGVESHSDRKPAFTLRGVWNNRDRVNGGKLRTPRKPNQGRTRTRRSDLNFLIAGYVYAQGKMAFDPDLGDRRRQIPLQYRGAGLCSVLRCRGPVGQVRCDRAGVVVLRAGNRERPAARARDVGPGRPAISRLGQFVWSAALSAKDFANYKQDLIVGVSLQVSAPLGQYDDSKLLNLGNNRWSFKPELGISKAWGQWTFEVAPSVTFFSDNTDFFGGNTFAQAPIYAVQGHILYTFQSGVWMALDGIYFAGGRTALNGVKSDNEQANTRAGFTLALPIDTHNSLKLSASTGITTRTGSEFSAVGVAWQYRWGDGY